MARKNLEAVAKKSAATFEQELTELGGKLRYATADLAAAFEDKRNELADIKEVIAEKKAELEEALTEVRALADKHASGNGRR